MLQLLKGVEAEAEASVIHAAQETPLTCVRLAEYFAQNILLERVTFSDAAPSLVVEKGTGRWATEFKKREHFLQSLPAMPTEHANFVRTESLAQPREKFELAWARDDLTNSERLGQQLERTLIEAREREQYVSAVEVLATARKAVDLGDRIAHLDALLAIKADVFDSDLISGLLAALSEWKTQPAIQRWCKAKLPQAISEFLPAFSRYFPQDDGRLDGALNPTSPPQK